MVVLRCALCYIHTITDGTRVVKGKDRQETVQFRGNHYTSGLFFVPKGHFAGTASGRKTCPEASSHKTELTHRQTRSAPTGARQPVRTGLMSLPCYRVACRDRMELHIGAYAIRHIIMYRNITNT